MPTCIGSRIEATIALPVLLVRSIVRVGILAVCGGLAETLHVGFEISGVDLNPWVEVAATRKQFGLAMFSSLAQAKHAHVNHAGMVSIFQVLKSICPIDSLR